MLDGVVQQQLDAGLATGLLSIGLPRCTDELLSTLEEATAYLNHLAQLYGTAQMCRTELLELRATPLRRIESCVEDLVRHRRAQILRSEVPPSAGQDQLCRQRAFVEAIFSELSVRARETGPRDRVRIVRRT